MSDLTESEQIENLNTVENIFDDEAPEEAEAKQEVPAEPEKAEKVEEKGEETAPPADAEEELEEAADTVPMKVALDERRKRQELEKEVKRLKETYEKQEDTQAPDPVEDPEGYKEYLRAQITGEERMNRIIASQEDMRLKHSDYDEMEAIFTKMAVLDPKLVDELNSHPKPAQFAYEKATEFMDSMRPKTETKEQKRKESAVKVPDLTKATTKVSNTTPVAKKQEFDALFADQSY